MSLKAASLFVGAVLLVAAAAPGVARADSSASSNWSGYVAHRGGVKFRQVSAGWTQPATACTPGSPTYSAVWVGLGGFSASSQALEQIGTEVDCNAAGHTVSSTWYELVPSPSRTIRMTVKPGDAMRASVQAVGHRVTLSLADRTRHTTFTKTVTAAAVDISSADWIVEAPSACVDAYQCRALPLADFGSVQFSGARAQTAAGRAGPISSSLWGTTKITLSPSPAGRRFVEYVAAGEATPTPLADAGSAFAVDYSQAPAGPQRFFDVNARAASAAPARPPAVQPGGRRST